MVYIPSYNSGNCVVVYNSDTVRVYDRQPQNNTTTNYIDYYINSHYLSNRGSTNYNYGVTCLQASDISTNWIYRNDLSDILLSFTCICIIIFFPISLLFKKAFRRL